MRSFARYPGTRSSSPMCSWVRWHVFPHNQSIPVRIFRVCVTACFASVFPPASPNVPNEFPHRFYGFLHCFSHVNVFEFDVWQKDFGTPAIETGWGILKWSYINGNVFRVPEQLHSRIVSARTRESPRDSAFNKLWKWVIVTQSLSSINTSLQSGSHCWKIFQSTLLGSNYNLALSAFHCGLAISRFHRVLKLDCAYFCL